MSSLLRSSKFLRYFAGTARNLIVSTRFSPETGSFINLSSPTTPYIRSLATQALSSAQQYATTLEKSLNQLDQDARRTGRISKKELEEVLDEIRQSKNATSSQSLMVIRCCGSLVSEELPEVRTRMVQEIWSTLEKLKVPMDISHYNALLRVYLENEHDFSPAEFLQELEKKGVEPNRVTYQRLITRYCQQGDIDGATKILEFMREKSLPVNESVFNALIMGHSQAEDMESAVGILSVMKQAGLDPSADTYTTLLVGFAKKGDMENIRKSIEECDKNEIHLMDKDYLEIVFSLATNGHAFEVDEILTRVRRSAGFNQDAVSIILRLINSRQEDVALKVFQLMPRIQREESQNIPSYHGSFLIKQLVKAKRPVEKIISICRQMEEEGINTKALSIATETALDQGNIDLALPFLKALQESGFPIRQHFFWPLICSAGRVQNDEKIAKILQEMSNNFGLNIWSETVREFIIPNLSIKNSDVIVGFLKKAGVTSGTTASSLVLTNLENGNITEAANVASKYRAFYQPFVFRRPLNQAYLNSNDTTNYLSIIHLITEGLQRGNTQGLEETDASLDSKEVVGSIVLDLLTCSRGRPVDLKPILEGLLERGLGITSGKAEQIQSNLSGERLTNEISDLLTKLTESELQATQAVRSKAPDSVFPSDSQSILKRIAKLEESGQSTLPLKRSLVAIYCKENDYDKAIETLESLGENAGPGAYAYLIEGLTFGGRLDDALKYVEKQRTLYPESSLDSLKLIRLVEQLFKNNRISEGIKLLEENRQDKKEDVPFVLKTAAFQSLNVLAEKGDVENLERTFELLVNKNYVEVTNVILGPLVKVHVVRNDLEKAINKLEELVEKYKFTPWKGELIKKLIEAENPTLLQRVTDIGSKVHGEVNSLYDLVFGFVECGRIRQARKILETPGMRNRQQRLNLVCERYQQEGSVAALEGLIEATKDMNHIDRSDIFYQLLLTYIKNDDPDKALGLWTQMQEEDIQSTDNFLLKLANYLESIGRSVPFVKPDLKTETLQIQPKIVENRRKAPSYVIGFRNAVRSKDFEKAKSIKSEADKSNNKLGASDLSLLLEGFCQANNLNDGFNLAENMLQAGNNITQKHFKFLTNKLSKAGEVEKLIKIGKIIDEETKKALSFDNKLCAAYINSGRVADYMNELFAKCESITPFTVNALSTAFPRGAIAGIIERNPEYLPKLEEIAEKFAKLGYRNCANSLWVALFLSPNLRDRADVVWTKFDLSSEPRLMFQRVLGEAKVLNDVTVIDRLLERLKGSQISESALGLIHSCALDLLVKANEVEGALSRLQTVLNDVSLENINTTSLIRLKELVEKNGKQFAYTIPDKNAPEVTSENNLAVSENSQCDVYTAFVQFKFKNQKNINPTRVAANIKDDFQLFQIYPFDVRSVIDATPLGHILKKESSSSSSSSDDEAEEKGAQK